MTTPLAKRLDASQLVGRVCQLSNSSLSKPPSFNFDHESCFDFHKKYYVFSQMTIADESLCWAVQRRSQDGNTKQFPFRPNGYFTVQILDSETDILI